MSSPNKAEHWKSLDSVWWARNGPSGDTRQDEVRRAYALMRKQSFTVGAIDAVSRFVTALLRLHIEETGDLRRTMRWYGSTWYREVQDTIEQQNKQRRKDIELILETLGISYTGAYDEAFPAFVTELTISADNKERLLELYTANNLAYAHLKRLWGVLCVRRGREPKVEDGDEG